MSTDVKEPERLEGEHVSEAVLLPLLQEYTERLRKECDSYLSSTLRSRGAATYMIYVAILCAMAVIVVNVCVLFQSATLNLYLSGIALAVGCALSIVLGVFLGVRRSSLDTQRDIFVRHEIRATAARLEKVVRLASQLEDHAVKDMGVKIKLDLRLADAEAALSLVEEVFDLGRSKMSRMGEPVPTRSPAEKRSQSSSLKTEEHLRERRI